MPTANNSRSEYIRLENRLVLLAWLNSLFGYKNNKELLTDLKNVGEGFDPYGRSYMFHHFAGRGDKVNIPGPILGRYDDNIKVHLDAMNRHRAEPITLRYFQYLAALYAEIFLDMYFNCRGKLLHELNDFVATRNSTKSPGEPEDSEFTENDLTKLAFWMATGSGKTLIMHFNYRQFLHYNRRELDNIILITPNEGLSEQHIEEMAASGIPCAPFQHGGKRVELKREEHGPGNRDNEARGAETGRRAQRPRGGLRGK